MKVQGTVAINAPREKVWSFLTDAEQVSQCAPGVESLEIIPPGDTFRAVASVGFGSMKVRFTLDAEWVDMKPIDRAGAKVHGTAPGSTVDATAEMNLSNGAEGGTQLDWMADVTVQGTIASLASRLMGSVTQRLTGEFFECVKGKIEA